MKTRIICIIGIFLWLNSCEKYFHQEDNSIARIENIIELEGAVHGAYGLLGEAYNSLDGEGFYAANLKADDLNVPSPAYDKDCNIPWKPNTIWEDYKESFPGDLWSKMYSLIISLNNIIVQYPNPLSYAREYQILIGEAYFLRAYSYFRLVRTYERIPLIYDIDITYNRGPASDVEVYKFIEQDLLLSTKLLPENRAESRIPGVSPHRGCAKALLAEVYLNWAGYPVSDIEKYTSAAQFAKEVIDSAQYFGFTLLTDFANLWDDSYSLTKETIFSLYFSDPKHTSIINEVNQVYQGRYFSIGPGSLSLGLNSYVDIFFFPTEIEFFNNYPSNYRKEITFFNRNFIATKYTFDPYKAIDGYFDTIKKVNPCSRIAFRKFYYSASILDTAHFNEQYQFNDYFMGSSKVYLIRYAHTLLTYAEASTRAGNLNQLSFECVNQIRRRANHLDPNTPSKYDLQPGLTDQVFLDSVVWERAWELAGEPEGRWFDLVRLEKVEELNTLRHREENGPPALPFNRDDYFFPVPDEERYLNPNL